MGNTESSEQQHPHLTYADTFPPGTRIAPPNPPKVVSAAIPLETQNAVQPNQATARAVALCLELSLGIENVLAYSLHKKACKILDSDTRTSIWDIVKGIDLYGVKTAGDPILPGNVEFKQVPNGRLRTYLTRGYTVVCLMSYNQQGVAACFRKNPNAPQEFEAIVFTEQPKVIAVNDLESVACPWICLGPKSPGNDKCEIEP